MNALRLLGGLAVLIIVLATLGALVSLSGALGRVDAVATGVLLVAAMAGLVAVAIGGAGGRKRLSTPYWR